MLQRHRHRYPGGTSWSARLTKTGCGLVGAASVVAFSQGAPAALDPEFDLQLGADSARGCAPNINLLGWPARIGNGDERLNSFLVGDIGFTPGREAITVSSVALNVISTNGQLLFTHPLPSSANYVPSLADLDHDGQADVVMTSSDGLQILNDGKVQMIVPGWDGYSARPIVLEDLDGDGEIEIIQIQDSNYGILHVRDRFGTDLPGWPVQPLVPDPDEHVRVFNSAPVVGDLDGDGRMEVVIQLLRGGFVVNDSPTIFAFDFEGNEMWSTRMGPDYVDFPTSNNDATWFNDVVLGDVDGDGYLEVVYLRYGLDRRRPGCARFIHP